jgi:hypothetical protein
MTYTLHFAVLVVACPLAAIALVRAGWTRRSPHTAILCWQALALTWTLSVIGALLAAGLAPYRLGIAPGLARAASDLVAGHLVETLEPARAAYPLATALQRFATTGDLSAPAGALGVTGAADSAIATRVERLLAPPPPLSWTAQLLLLATATTAVATPVSLFALPS